MSSYEKLKLDLISAVGGCGDVMDNATMLKARAFGYYLVNSYNKIRLEPYEIDEIVQSFSIRLHRNFSKIDRKRNVAAYIRAMVRTEIFGFVRKKIKRNSKFITNYKFEEGDNE